MDQLKQESIYKTWIKNFENFEKKIYDH